MACLVLNRHQNTIWTNDALIYWTYLRHLPWVSWYCWTMQSGSHIGPLILFWHSFESLNPFQIYRWEALRKKIKNFWFQMVISNTLQCRLLHTMHTSEVWACWFLSLIISCLFPVHVGCGQYVWDPHGISHPSQVGLALACRSLSVAHAHHHRGMLCKFLALLFFLGVGSG